MLNSFVLLAGGFLFGGDTDKTIPEISQEEKRLQSFWRDYYGVLRKYYEGLDRLDWVTYYKNHGKRINVTTGPNEVRRVQFAPVFIDPPKISNETPPVPEEFPAPPLPNFLFKEKIPVPLKPTIGKVPDKRWDDGGYVQPPPGLPSAETLKMYGWLKSSINPPEATPARSDSVARPVGTWKRDIGTCHVTLRIENDRLFGTCRLVKEEEIVTIEIEADYSLTKDSVLYGVVSSVEVKVPDSTKEGAQNARTNALKFIDQPFSIRFRVDDNVMTVKDVKMAGIGLREELNDRDEELLAVLVGRYVASNMVRSSYSQPLPEPKAKTKEAKRADLAKAFAVLVQQVAPKADIKPLQNDKTVVLTGTVEKQEHLQAVMDLAKIVWPSPAKVVNSMRVTAAPEVQRVQLDIEMIRVKRSETRHMASDSITKETKYYTGSILKRGAQTSTISLKVEEGKLPAGIVYCASKFFLSLNASGHKDGALFVTVPSLVTSSGTSNTISGAGTSLNLVATVKGKKILLEEEVSSGDSRQARVSMLMDDGQTMVIGGLFTTNEKKIKAPFMDVPFFGEALRSVCYDEIEEEVIILVTPRIQMMPPPFSQQ